MWSGSPVLAVVVVWGGMMCARVQLRLQRFVLCVQGGALQKGRVMALSRLRYFVQVVHAAIISVQHRPPPGQCYVKSVVFWRCASLLGILLRSPPFPPCSFVLVIFVPLFQPRCMCVCASALRVARALCCLVVISLLCLVLRYFVLLLI